MNRKMIKLAGLAGMVMAYWIATQQTAHLNVPTNEIDLLDTEMDLRDFMGLTAATRSFITTRGGDETIQKPEGDWAMYETLLANYE
ncbi:hypothetical protein M1D52_10680 [Olivibacter sp. SA151]|uniref:hypothetical protein n=1 Tax=Olivibacter jilunii TaxID=985016 RepID=UPI003F17876A